MPAHNDRLGSPGVGRAAVMADSWLAGMLAFSELFGAGAHSGNMEDSEGHSAEESGQGLLHNAGGVPSYFNTMYTQQSLRSIGSDHEDCLPGRYM